ncbi:hypothetical protein [Mycolicibacterium conceptionense]|uniref:Uncharacterized protein n=1 Tax=Mycolicibacterium conceptionense TaxID=451644 RepID=A0A1A1YK64_9MYCO|nr:hypothetical protein [Mycolicibacterium conceptionense]OBF14414.1 hypothetical protein A5726_24965 [Mycolicibacterium conceptionense]OBF31694.1 hypothetical protein A5720_28080 [Mycolicibacterium conceptionense]OBH97032.1 hypothetical protein A5716_16845 [Mycolicibacterium conceptionense]
MNRNDVIDVLSVVAAATRRTIGETDVEVWQRIIAPLPKDVAMEAVRDHLRDKPGVWLEPGHVYQRAREIMRERNCRPSADYQALCDSKAAPDEDPAVTAQRRAAIEAFANARKNFGQPKDDPERIADLVARQREAAPPAPMMDGEGIE